MFALASSASDSRGPAEIAPGPGSGWIAPDRWSTA